MEKKKDYFEAAERYGRKVKGVDLTTYILELVDANMLEVEVGTTGFKGGDTGHGCRTYFSIHDLASTDMTCTLDEGSGITIELGGDAELKTFVEALEFAVDVLKWQMSGGHTGMELMTKKEAKQQSFRTYLYNLIQLYHDTGKLSGMSALCRKFKVSGITQAQFFEMGLHKAAAKEDYLLSKEFCNNAYEYILGHTKEKPEYGAPMKMKPLGDMLKKCSSK